MQPDSKPRRLGIAIQGLGGAVATTAAAGLALLRRGLIDTAGLPVARLQRQRPQLNLPLAPYDHIAFAGWDPYPADLLNAARGHDVLPAHQLDAVADELSALRPWPALTRQAATGPEGGHVMAVRGHRDAIDQVRRDLEGFKSDARLDSVVLLNLSSTEPNPREADCLDTPEALEQALDADDPRISPSVLYAYAAITAGMPHVNFTPTRVTDWPAMADLARRRGVPVCGKDGKTGQTFLKTVLAPAFRDRHLVVDGWFSTNLLGNRDGEVLADPPALQSKLATKTDVLDGILGYPVADHQVHIHYYRPRGDAKEAWDNIDLAGFAGQKMQVKVNFLCRDSILAAPLAIDLCRLADLAQLRGQGGVVEALAVFFKSPMSSASAAEHDFFRQQAAFETWLESGEMART
jgi:myo-inositol-1-phosphate synthase